MNANDSAQIDRLFHALADATRRDILRRLLTGPITTGEIAEDYEMTLAAIGKHLKVLETADLITTQKVGRARVAVLNIETLQRVQIWLETVDDGAVDAVETAVKLAVDWVESGD